jgi:hypothetical protein
MVYIVAFFNGLHRHLFQWFTSSPFLMVYIVTFFNGLHRHLF